LLLKRTHVPTKPSSPHSDKPVDLPPNANPHVISGVLKLWFCELEQPIMTFELYDAFIAAMGKQNNLFDLLSSSSSFVTRLVVLCCL